MSEPVGAANSGDSRIAHYGHLGGIAAAEVRLALDDIAGQVCTMAAALHLGVIAPDEMAAQALIKPVAPVAELRFAA